MLLRQVQPSMRPTLQMQVSALQKTHPDKEIVLLSYQERSLLYHALKMQWDYEESVMADVEELADDDKESLGDIFGEQMMLYSAIKAMDEDSVAFDTTDGIVFLVAFDKQYSPLMRAFTDGCCRLVDAYSRKFLKEGAFDDIYGREELPTF